MHAAAVYCGCRAPTCWRCRPEASRYSRGVPCRRLSSKPICPDCSCRRGKVRDIYDLGDRLLLVSTDRISAFDWVLPTPHSRQGPRADAAQPLLVPAAATCRTICWKPTSSEIDLPAGVDRDAARRPHACWCARPKSCRSSASCAAYLSRLGVEGISRDGPRARHRRCRRVCGNRTAAGADLHARHQGAAGRARREHHVRRNAVAASAPSWPSNCGSAASTIYARGARHALERGIILADTKFEFGCCQSRPSRRRPDDFSDRRSADARQLAVLARRRLQAGPQPAVVRQAVRPRLAHRKAAGTRTARRRSCPPKSSSRRGRSTSRPSSESRARSSCVELGQRTSRHRGCLPCVNAKHWHGFACWRRCHCVAYSGLLRFLVS